MRYSYFVIKKENSQNETQGSDTFLFSNVFEGHKKGIGTYAHWQWKDGKLVAENDFFGFYNLFYYYDNNQFAISNSLVKLLALGIPNDYDETALSVFCRCGFFMGNDTPFKHIKTLPPSSRLTWAEGQLSIDSQDVLVTSVTSIDKAVDLYIEYFRDSVERYTLSLGDFAMPLTGGRDSRQILLELNRRKRLPRVAITSGDLRDRKIAKQIADRLNIRHEVFDSAQYVAKTNFKKNVLSNFCSLELSWLMPFREYCSRQHKYSFDGTGVGALTRGDLNTLKYVELFEKDKYPDVAQLLIKKLSPPEMHLKGIPGFEFVSEFHDAIDFIVDSLLRYKDAVYPGTAFTFWNWNRRGIAMAPFGIQSTFGGICLTPFLDEKLYRLAASIAPRDLLRLEPQTAALQKAYPEFSDIPFNDRLPPMKSRKNYWTSLSNHLYRYNSIKKMCPELLPKYNEAVFKNKHHRSRTLDVIQYLAQLSYISDPANASSVLNDLDL